MNRCRHLILLLCLAFSTSALADLKVYEIDAKYRQEVFEALRGVLAAGQPPSSGGPVQLLPTGQILIDATPQMHQQVAAVIEAISEYEAEPAPRVTLQYWVVLGTRDEFAGTTEPPAILSDVLNEIRQVHGRLSFRVLGNATLVTESGRHGRNTGELQIGQLAYVQGATLNAELEIGFQFQVSMAVVQPGNPNPFQTTRTEGQNMNLNTTMERDEFVVVGENTITQDVGSGQSEFDGTVFYIVHWPAAE